ncbi:hypothetical protein X927_04925 [Petrotoga mexicana DSM 14811]|jgi:hypothetical protein|uniref:Uncharacterized protein n=1 Tax=Petrotoga mexicana DSM 14811 TaxID=1122954 RepID=A0A2K1PAF1_9BACT|nr:hypothetical protein [Petrotoga mexicana]PNR99769.1 hypothetical protein X927_04925 [Petrotoga mexicana DSM 14811]
MKMTEDLKKAYENMKPGVITADGFLGDDERLLVDIIESDEEKIRALNINLQDDLKKIRYLFEKGKEAFEEPVTVDNKWLIKVDEARGHLPCPFEDGIFRKVNLRIKNLDNKEELLITELSLHLIEKHHFFQGKGSAFRVEPEKLKKVLEE